MTVLVYLIPIALVLGLGALFAFLWALKSGQYEDLDGAASRILFEEDDTKTTAPPTQSKTEDQASSSTTDKSSGAS